MQIENKKSGRYRLIFLVVLALLFLGRGAWGQEALPQAAELKHNDSNAQYERSVQESFDKPVQESFDKPDNSVQDNQQASFLHKFPPPQLQSQEKLQVQSQENKNNTPGSLKKKRADKTDQKRAPTSILDFYVSPNSSGAESDRSGLTDFTRGRSPGNSSVPKGAPGNSSPGSSSLAIKVAPGNAVTGTQLPKSMQNMSFWEVYDVVNDRSPTKRNEKKKNAETEKKKGLQDNYNSLLPQEK